MNFNPATGEVIAEFPSATDVRSNGHPIRPSCSQQLARGPSGTRRALFDLRGKIEEHFDRLCRVQVQDHGRTIGEARGTLRRCIENIESACSALLLLTGANA